MAIFAQLLVACYVQSKLPTAIPCCLLCHMQGHSFPMQLSLKEVKQGDTKPYMVRRGCTSLQMHVCLAERTASSGSSCNQSPAVDGPHVQGTHETGTHKAVRSTLLPAFHPAAPMQAIMRPVKQDVHEAFVWVGSAGQVVGVDKGFSDMFGWTMVRGGAGGRGECLRERGGNVGTLLIDLLTAGRQLVWLTNHDALWLSCLMAAPLSPPCCRSTCTVGARARAAAAGFGVVLLGAPALTQLCKWPAGCPRTPLRSLLPLLLANRRRAGGQHRRRRQPDHPVCCGGRPAEEGGCRAVSDGSGARLCRRLMQSCCGGSERLAKCAAPLVAFPTLHCQAAPTCTAPLFYAPQWEYKAGEVGKAQLVVSAPVALPDPTTCIRVRSSAVGVQG